MRAEVIALGDELTSGVRLDTNSQWLSQQLQMLGMAVAYHTTVGDQLEPIKVALETAFARADLVVMTGGLGPTADDLTREALAAATGCPLQLDQSVLAHIQNLFASRGRIMPERNVVQAHFPVGSHVIANPHGTAPGIEVIVPRPPRDPCHVFALPGVPAELKQMWSESVQPRIRQLPHAPKNVIRHRSICCFGAGESDIEGRLPDLVRRGRYPSVGITASQATITLRVTACEPTVEACDSAIEPTVATIYQCLGELIYGEDDDQLQDAVVRSLVQRHMSLASVELATDGQLAQWLSEAAATTPCFRGGLVAPNELAARQMLSLEESQSDRDLAERVDELAHAVRLHCGADFGLAVGPRPTAENDSASPAHIHLAFATPNAIVHGSQVFAAHPSIQRPRSAKQALNLARLTLMRFNA